MAPSPSTTTPVRPTWCSTCWAGTPEDAGGGRNLPGRGSRVAEDNLGREDGPTGGPTQRRQHRPPQHQDQDGSRGGPGEVEAQDVVRSKKKKRCRFAMVPAPARKEYDVVEPTKGQNQKLVSRP